MRARRRFSRTLSRARWREYAALLQSAVEAGYEVVSLERWVLEGETGSPTLVLRHDVDQHPRSARPMAAIEERAGVRSTWYFRWRTAHPRVIADLRSRGFEVGFHYETLTRARLLAGNQRTEPTESLIRQCRLELKAEIAAFGARHGPIRSICPHGDSRVPGIHNGVLLRGEEIADYGAHFDGNEAMRGRGLKHWLTDRSAAEGGWADGTDPLTLLAEQVSPILCLTHPNNWVSGPDLWLDRALRFALPARVPSRPIRTLGDAPHLVARPWETSPGMASLGEELRAS
jgi:hypothetical protein